jgi:hypothetical protein
MMRRKQRTLVVPVAKAQPACGARARSSRVSASAEADEALLERLQRGAFAYILRYANPTNGLIADTSRAGSPCSIAVVGFALSSYIVAVERGWLSREAAAERVLVTLRFFLRSVQGDSPAGSGYKGFYYHFLDMQSGERVWRCELSLIDSTLLVAGFLSVGLYFDRPGEAEIREVADALYARVDWRWAQNEAASLSQGWLPEFGFLHYGWEGYNEALILYILALGSATHPLLPNAFATWTVTYQWERVFGQDVLYSGPLFTHLFSHAWIDFRGIRDAFMREKRSDYFQNTCRTVELQREYCERNPRQNPGYGRDIWGISAGDGPSGEGVREFATDRRHFGYMARGVPFGPDDGTLCPWAMLATLPFTPAAALDGTRLLLKTFPQACSEDRFASGFNPGVDPDKGGWVSEGWYGLDQGLLVMMIENGRSGLLWSLLRESPIVRRGLRHAGFSGGWLSG